MKCRKINDVEVYLIYSFRKKSHYHVIGIIVALFDSAQRLEADNIKNCRGGKT